MDDLWKLLHVLAGFGFVAGLVGRTVAIGRARREASLPTSLVLFLATAALVPAVFLPRGKAFEGPSMGRGAPAP